MAGSGRQRLYRCLASNTATEASAAAIDARAYSRAPTSRWSLLILATCIWLGLYVRGPVRNQKRAIVVCAAVRVLLAMPPTSRIPLKSRVQVSESSAGGAGGRNCLGPLITQGRYAATVLPSASAVGIYTPGL